VAARILWEKKEKKKNHPCSLGDNLMKSRQKSGLLFFRVISISQETAMRISEKFENFKII
jgi:hypothetical protein